jgi:hypothetical protein
MLANAKICYKSPKKNIQPNFQPKKYVQPDKRYVFAEFNFIDLPQE